MQQTPQKTILMSANGATTTKAFVFDWASLIQGVLAAGMISCIAFLIKMNSNMAVIQEQKVQEQAIHNDFKQDINQIKLDIRDLRDRAIRAERLETKTN